MSPYDTIFFHKFIKFSHYASLLSVFQSSSAFYCSNRCCSQIIHKKKVSRPVLKIPCHLIWILTRNLPNTKRCILAAFCGGCASHDTLNLSYFKPASDSLSLSNLLFHTEATGCLLIYHLSLLSHTYPFKPMTKLIKRLRVYIC